MRVAITYGSVNIHSKWEDIDKLFTRHVYVLVFHDVSSAVRNDSKCTSRLSPSRLRGSRHGNPERADRLNHLKQPLTFEFETDDNLSNDPVDWGIWPPKLPKLPGRDAKLPKLTQVRVWISILYS